MENKTEKRPAGNAAALREALESTEELLEHFAKPGTMLGDAFAFHMRDNRAALYEPPRNCDRFGDELDAQLAFLNEEWLISVDRDSMLEKDRFENWTDEMRSAYARWLMAKTEGDNHDNA